MQLVGKYMFSGADKPDAPADAAPAATEIPSPEATTEPTR
jgi:hypothetical protein